ncbi:uncharacterized protein ARMOST_06528 [Armillaria ostoyae]|uniref:Uncharacterized protein n=1 Tax=Armillaria ostoyae TaxID=47428 RepID=A0A284R3B2_ARMOS|nr:uncharacterized protein ARMOST_06528 [Armillaria ostoyae]
MGSHLRTTTLTYCMRFLDDESSVRVEGNTLHITIAQLLSLRHVILRILNWSAEVHEINVLMNIMCTCLKPVNTVLIEDCNTLQASALSRDWVLFLWLKPEECSPFTTMGADYAIAIFIPFEKSSNNHYLSLSYALLRFVSRSAMIDGNQSKGNVVSIAYEFNKTGVFAILLLDGGFKYACEEAERAAQDYPEKYMASPHSIPMSTWPLFDDACLAFMKDDHVLNHVLEHIG